MMLIKKKPFIWAMFELMKLNGMSLCCIESIDKTMMDSNGENHICNR